MGQGFILCAPEWQIPKVTSVLQGQNPKDHKHRTQKSTTALTELTARQRRVPEAVFFAGGRVAAVHGVAKIAVEDDGVSVDVRSPVPAQQLPVLHARLLAVHHCAGKTPPLRKSAVTLKRGARVLKTHS